MSLPAALFPLAAYQQFVIFRKSDKAPCDYRTGAVCDAQNSANHTDAATAHTSAASRPGYGVGFVLTAADPFFVADADHALLPDNTWSAESLKLVAAFPGAAVEVSTSGCGFHIWGTYSGAMPAHACKNTALGFELYDSGRYIALGGYDGTVGNAATDCTDALPAAITRWFAPSVAPVVSPATSERRPEWRGPEDDDELIRRMLNCRQGVAAALAGNATIRDLWEGNVEALVRTWPRDGSYDASSADAALAMHLAFWTGCDAERMERLMRRSGLRRDKYDREDYLPLRTIPSAIRATGRCYVEPASEPMPVESVPADVSDGAVLPQARVVEGFTLVFPSKQSVAWRGQVYVEEGEYILAPNGARRTQSQFKARYGGRSYVMDKDNLMKPTRNAWEAFMDSQALSHPKVDRASFRPDLPFRHLWEESGMTYVNDHTPLNVRRTAGDPGPFLRHIDMLLEHQRDRDILIAAMTCLVQLQGHKSGWALFIQGTHGNGKSLLTECLVNALGFDACHPARADQLTEDKNEFLLRKTLVYVEDIHQPQAAHRENMQEILKPMITQEWQPIRAMGVAQRSMRVCYNILVNSNHKDGIRKTDEDRRFVPLFCRQQRKEHLARDGMDEKYFTDLTNWLRREDGFAIVAEFLHTNRLAPEFNLDWFKGRAPITSSTVEAVEASKGRIEQEIEEAVASGRYGFCGGWVATHEITRLLGEKRLERMLPIVRYPEMMRSLGYARHPGLRGGRLTTPLTNGGITPVVYILREGHPGWGLTGAAVTVAYEQAQNSGMIAVFGKGDAA